jgi:hypothetical protein
VPRPSTKWATLPWAKPIKPEQAPVVVCAGHDDDVVMLEVPVDASGQLLKAFTGDVRDAARRRHMIA